MSSNDRAARPTEPTEPSVVYTIYQGTLPVNGNVNYGFHPNHPLAPPPQYEEVMSGRPLEPQPPSSHFGPYQQDIRPSGVIFVPPIYKRTRLQRRLYLLSSIIFFAVFVFILIKILGAT